MPEADSKEQEPILKQCQWQVGELLTCTSLWLKLVCPNSPAYQSTAHLDPVSSVYVQGIATSKIRLLLLLLLLLVSFFFFFSCNSNQHPNLKYLGPQSYN